MEKVIRRTHLAVNQAKRRSRLRDEVTLKKQRFRYRNRLADYNYQMRYPAVLERRTRQEDWMLGPLAPWRDPKVTQELFATYTDANLPEYPRAWQVKDHFIRKGDRVCVTKGKAGIQGKIGVVERVLKKQNAVELRGFNIVDFKIPSYLKASADADDTSSRALAIPLSDVQLVYPLPDPVTGTPRDCLLTNLEKRDEYFDRYKNRKEWSRYLMPQGVKIPWPEEDVPEYYDEPEDTVRLDVEDNTFIPTLLTPPMPETVIDELRNRFSRFRMRHDDEYIRKKTQEDLEAKQLNKMRRALVPRGAKNMARRPLIPLANWKQVQERIGQHMAEKGLLVSNEDQLAPRSSSSTS